MYMASPDAKKATMLANPFGWARRCNGIALISDLGSYGSIADLFVDERSRSINDRDEWYTRAKTQHF
jgi:hypothetical protein